MSLLALLILLLFLQFLTFLENARKYPEIFSTCIIKHYHLVNHHHVHFVLCLLALFFVLDPQPVFNLQPSNPSSVVEGQNLILQWSYNIGGKSIFGARFRNVTGSTPISVAIRRGNNNASVEPGYENQFRATISDTEAMLTILAVPRTRHEEKYQLVMVFDDVTDLISGEVKISVLCKFTFDTAIKGTL